MSHADHDHEIVMPFVTVTSKGGPHDDSAYVAGWECGAIDARLAVLVAAQVGVYATSVRTENIPQVDLIAMRHGYRLEHRVCVDDDGDEVSGWSDVQFSPAGEDVE